MAEPHENDADNGTEDRDTAHELLEAFNAEDVIDHPGEPPRPETSPTSESDAPAPG